MWTTQDGYRLELSNENLEAVAGEIGALGGAAGSQSCPTCGSGNNLADQIGQAVASATRVGTLRNKRTGEELPVFVGRVGDQEFEIVAELEGEGEYEGEDEYEGEGEYAGEYEGEGEDEYGRRGFRRGGFRRFGGRGWGRRGHFGRWRNWRRWGGRFGGWGGWPQVAEPAYDEPPPEEDGGGEGEEEYRRYYRYGRILRFRPWRRGWGWGARWAPWGYGRWAAPRPWWPAPAPVVVPPPVVRVAPAYVPRARPVVEGPPPGDRNAGPPPGGGAQDGPPRGGGRRRGREAPPENPRPGGAQAQQAPPPGGEPGGPPPGQLNGAGAPEGGQGEYYGEYEYWR
jgi:hypothetical protein